MVFTWMFWSIFASISRRKLMTSSVGNSPNSSDFNRRTNSSRPTISTMQSCSYSSQSRSFVVLPSEVGWKSSPMFASVPPIPPADDEWGGADDYHGVPDLRKAPAQELIFKVGDHGIRVILECRRKALHSP